MNVSGVTPFQGGLQADQARQKPARAGLRRDTDFVEHKTHAGFVRQQPYVHGAGHGRAYTDSGTVDGANDGLFAFVHGQGHGASGVAHAMRDGLGMQFGLHIFQRRVHGFVQTEHIAAHAQVHAGTKRLTGTGNHDSAHVIVFAGTLKCMNEFPRHLHCESIQLLWPVQGQGQNLVCNLVAKCVVSFHVGSARFEIKYETIDRMQFIVERRPSLHSRNSWHKNYSE